MRKFTETAWGLVIFLVLFIVMVVLQRPPDKEIITGPSAIVLGVGTATFASVILVKLVLARRRRALAREADKEAEKK